MILRRLCYFAASVLVFALTSFGQTLKVATVNFWSGLDYRGNWMMGEYETPERRAKRFSLLVDELSHQRPDVIAFQEADPLSINAPALARVLEYDLVYQRTNAGIKVGRLGPPWNLDDGLAILARKGLQLEFVDVWDLSQGFGLYGNGFSFHFTERNAALVAKIQVSGSEIVLVNVHLSSPPPDEEPVQTQLEHILAAGNFSEGDRAMYREEFRAKATKRMRQLRLLQEQMEQAIKGRRMILLGDLNAPPDSPELRFLSEELKLFNASASSEQDQLITWDAKQNLNARYSLDSLDARGELLDPLGRLSAWYDQFPRRLDYILLNEQFQKDDVKSVSLFLHQPRDGVFISDHFGVLAEIDLSRVLTSPASPQLPLVQRNWDSLPILSYDTDVGLGYGAKLFLLNYAGWSESFDITAFNSTKGERWYRFVFSIPDFELRQGTMYPLAFDLVADYDKYLVNNFYGVGDATRKEDRETYTKEPLDISATLSRGFSQSLVGQIGIRYKAVRNVGYHPTGSFSRQAPVNLGKSSALTVFGSLRYDSRDSYINPSRGAVLQLDLEGGDASWGGDYSLRSYRLTYQTYSVLFYPKSVFAFRWMVQGIDGENLPLHTLSSLGGTRTLRGYPQDRFLDKLMLLGNVELRFPLYGRLGGVLGYDAGKVWESLNTMDAHSWARNSVLGLRYYFDTFVVRLDVGFSRESTGLYLNFGQLF